MRPRRSNFLFAAWVVTLTSFPGEAFSQDSLADLPSFRQGCVALEDGRFETATSLLEETWVALETGEAGDAEKDFVASRILRSHVENGSFSEALQWLGDNSLASPSSETNLSAARIYQAEGFFFEAAQYYKKLDAKKKNLDPLVALNYAICLARSNEPGAALDAIATLPAPTSPEEAIRRAQISAGAGEYEAALQLLDEVVDDDSIASELRLALIQTRIHSLENLDRNAEAVAIISELIQSAKTPGEALIAFLILEQTTEGKSVSGLKDQMTEWDKDTDHPATTTIALFDLLWFSPPDNLISDLENLAKIIKDEPVIAEIQLRLSLMENERFLEEDGTESLYSDADLVARRDFLRASSLYHKGSFEDTTEQFVASANRLNGQSRSAALYNGAISTLQSGNMEQFTRIQKRLQAIDPTSLLNAELKFLQGLSLAAKADPSAFEILTQFTGDHPNHIRFVEAQLAIAEIQLNQAPARPKAARDIFEQLQSRSLTLLQQERLDYLSIWASLMANESAPLLDLTDKFLTHWPNSVYLPEVCMLSASHYYEIKQRVLAKEQFIKIAEEFPQSDYAEIARFFAAKSTPRSESTISEWKLIIQGGGKLAPYASHELGLLYLSLSRFEEARTAFEEIISKEGSPESLLYAVQADLGFAWYSEALTNNENKDQLKEAAEVFTTLSSSTHAPNFWRYNAAVRRGKCLEALGSDDIALEIYRSIVDETGSSDSLLLPEMTMRELDWVFRAGFSAITLLKEREDWPSAIRVADSLANRDGSRSFEATRLARSLRLKHWVWE